MFPSVIWQFPLHDLDCDDGGRAGHGLSAPGTFILVDATAAPCLVPEWPAKRKARKTSLSPALHDSVFAKP